MTLYVPPWFQSEAGVWLPSTLSDLTEPGSAAVSGAERPEGFVVVSREQPFRPLAQFHVYATEAALGLQETRWDEVLELVDGLPAEPALGAIAHVEMRLWQSSMDPRLHLATAAEFFASPIVDELAAWVRKASNHVVFSEQALVALQRLVLARGSDGRRLDPDQLVRLKRLVLALPNFIDVEARRLRHSANGSPDWLPFITQNFAYYARDNTGNSLGRAWRIFAELAAELDADAVATYAPIDEWANNSIGLSVEQQLSLGFTLFASAGVIDFDKAPSPVVSAGVLEQAIDEMRLDGAAADAARRALVAPRLEFQEELAASEEPSSDPVPLSRKPFLRRDDGELLLLSPRAIESWLTDGFYYRLLDAAKSAEPRAGINRLTAYLGHLIERYVLELVLSAHRPPRLPNAGQVSGEVDYRSGGAQTSDVAVAYPNELVLLEVSSPRLTRQARTPSGYEALERDLGRIVGGRIKQLDQVIEAVKPRDGISAPEVTIPGVEGFRIATFRPVIVTVEPVHMTPPLSDYLARENPDRPDRTDVAAVEIMDLEELEFLMGAVEGGGSFKDLLRRKQEEAGVHSSVGQWLANARPRTTAIRPTYVDHALQRALDRAGELLGVKPEDWEREQAA